MSDSLRSWLRRIGTVAGLAMMAYGLYTALIHKVDCPQSTPQVGYACDPGPASHPHFLLGLLIFVAGLAVLVGSRRYLAYFER